MKLVSIANECRSTMMQGLTPPSTRALLQAAALVTQLDRQDAFECVITHLLINALTDEPSLKISLLEALRAKGLLDEEPQVLNIMPFRSATIRAEDIADF
jgi:hypothetical protein